MLIARTLAVILVSGNKLFRVAYSPYTIIIQSSPVTEQLLIRANDPV